MIIMARVITFSRNFPAHHIKAGRGTDFVQKLWLSFIDCGIISLSRCCEMSAETGIGNFDMNNLRKCDLKPKHHTIRGGYRWKPGDKFSPRVWSDKPYASKQIIIGPDVEIAKTFDFVMNLNSRPHFRVNGKGLDDHGVDRLAMNDGLSTDDMEHWLSPRSIVHSGYFQGQILCWNPEIEY